MNIFFQAEDGIRDIGVTGVQTCALPIFMSPVSARPAANSSTVSPGCGSSLRTIHSLTGREAFHSSSRRAYQPEATASHEALLCWRAASCCAEISSGDVISLSLVPLLE